MLLVVGLCPTRWEAIALPRPPGRYKGRKGREGMGRKGLGIVGRERNGRESKDVKGQGGKGKGKKGWEGEEGSGRGKEGKKRGGRARLGYLSGAPSF